MSITMRRVDIEKTKTLLELGCRIEKIDNDGDRLFCSLDGKLFSLNETYLYVETGNELYTYEDVCAIKLEMERLRDKK